MILYGKQYVDEEDIKEVIEVLKSDFLTTGPKVKEFEENFSDYVGAKYAVAVSSGTAALHLSCLVAGLKKNEKLITSPMTFVASANCALYCGAKPVFVDINEQGLIDENKIEENVDDKTKIIIPVHYSGSPCNMKKIKEIADKHNLIIIEDACHALGAEYEKSKIGSCKYSDMTVFSFHPVKHITTGEGGMITTNSKRLYEHLLLLRSHGITKDSNKLINKNEGPWYQEMQELGFNYRITDFQCALGISQLKKIDMFIEKRKEIVRIYDNFIKKNLKYFEFFEMPVDRRSSHHLYVLKLKERDKRKYFLEGLKAEDIVLQVHYVPIHLQPYYKLMFGYSEGDFPNAENFYKKIISLPIYYNLTKDEISKVIDTLGKLINRGN